MRRWTSPRSKWSWASPSVGVARVSVAHDQEGRQGRAQARRLRPGPPAQAREQAPGREGGKGDQHGQDRHAVTGGGKEQQDRRGIAQRVEPQQGRGIAPDPQAQPQAEQAQGSDQAEGDGEVPVPEEEAQDRRVPAGVVDVLVALDLGAAPEVKGLPAQQLQVVEGMGGDPGQALAQEEGGLRRSRHVARPPRLGDHLLPLHPRPQGDGAIVVGVVADVEVDAAVGGDEDQPRLGGPVAQGDGQDHQQGAAGEGGEGARGAAAPEVPGAEDQGEEQDVGPGQGRQPGRQTGQPPVEAPVALHRPQEELEEQEVEKDLHRHGEQLALEVEEGAAQGRGAARDSTGRLAEGPPREPVDEEAGKGPEQDLEEPDADEVRPGQQPAEKGQQVDVERGLPEGFGPAEEISAGDRPGLLEEGPGVDDGRVEERTGAVLVDVTQAQGEGRQQEDAGKEPGPVAHGREADRCRRPRDPGSAPQ